ncbi:MAG: ferredoxin--NADP reductase [Pseudomonadota bacterium]
METRTPMIIPESKAFETVEVLWVKHWNDRLFSFAVSRPRSFRFRSGEFIMIGMPVDGKPLVRAYSVASPSYAEELEFLSIKVEDGPLTSRLQNIQVGDQLYLGRKPTGTLVSEALRPGKRLYLLSTGTGLAPFLSIIRDPDIYERFEHVIVVHSVRQVSDLANYEELSTKLKDDPLVEEEAAKQFHYIPTVTREEFHNNVRIDKLIENGTLFADPIEGPDHFDPENDRVMLCGSMEMIKQFSDYFEGLNFEEGSNAKPGDFVIERAFVG